MTSKERRIQKALGLGDELPPTIGFKIKYWWWKHITVHTYKWLHWDTLYQWFAFRLPKKLVYHCVIRMWAHATTCPSGSGEDITVTTMSNAIRRWEKE